MFFLFLLLQVQWMRMEKRNDREHRIRGIRLWSLKKNFTSIVTWQGGGVLRSLMLSVWQNVRSRYGSKIDEWSGRKNIRWRVWTLCRITCRHMDTRINLRRTQASSLIWLHRTSSRPPSSEHTLSGFRVCMASRTSKASSCKRRQLTYETDWVEWRRYF